jgi:hypothetical protein
VVHVIGKSALERKVDQVVFPGTTVDVEGVRAGLIVQSGVAPEIVLPLPDQYREMVPFGSLLNGSYWGEWSGRVSLNMGLRHKAQEKTEEQ